MGNSASVPTMPSSVVKNKHLLRDFTCDQLPLFSGVNGSKLYLALNGNVYDASEGVSASTPLASFLRLSAGKIVTEELLKEEYDINNNSGTNSDKNWVDAIVALPMVGKISSPPTDLVLSKKELKLYNGEQSTPPGRIHPPIFTVLNGTIFDVSYGGYDNYCVGGSYHLFAGADASRALGKMSLSDEDVENSDISDFTESDMETLADWEKKFREGRKYPVVGELIAGE